MRLVHLLIVCLFIARSIADEAEDVENEEVSVVDVPYESPTVARHENVYFAEHFDDKQQFKKRWVPSDAKKENMDEDIAKYDGKWQLETALKDALRGDQGLVLKSKAKHAAIAAPLHKPFEFDAKPLFLQYEVIFQDGQECGGAYLKLLSQNTNLKEFHDKTPYSIMFGPDKCGNENKLHFIFKHRNPLNGSFAEKHCKKPKDRIDEIFTDHLPHLFQLVIYPDNRFTVSVDKTIVNSGSLLEDFDPAVNPPKTIADPTDKKPADWDEREQIPDPLASKPEDWDDDAPVQIVDEDATMPDGWLEAEPTHIPDEKAVKPDDWDNEMDGEWEPPLLENPACKEAPGCGKWEPPLKPNPAYRGKWKAPMIDNPNYKGKWAPRTIPNPDYFEDKQPFRMETITAVGFELWSMSKDIYFDNILITDDSSIADMWARETYDKKRQKINQSSESLVQRIANLTYQYPLLWLLYIVVLGIPVVMLLYFCCGSKASSDKQEKEQLLRTSGEHKKTDDVIDDIAEEPEENVSSHSNKEHLREDEGVDEDEEREKNSEPSGSDEEDDGSKEENGVVEETVDVGEVDHNEDVANGVKMEEIGTEGLPRKRKVRKE